MLNVMLDLETCSLQLNAAVLQIGLVRFEMTEQGDPKIGESLLVNINLAELLMSDKVHIDHETLEWWAREEHADARAALWNPRPILAVNALDQVRGFLEHRETLLWAHGTGFDTAVLKGYYERRGEQAPWSYRNERDTRSYHEAAVQLGWDAEYVEPNLAHNALSDCTAQIYRLNKGYQWISKYKSS